MKMKKHIFKHSKKPIKQLFCHNNNADIWEGTSCAPSLFVWAEYDRKEEHKGGYQT